MEQTFGQKLVGLPFNPSGNEKVQRVKELCAELADILEEAKQESFDEGTFNSLYEKLYNHSVGEILNAQMNVVKVLTFK